MMIKDVPIKYLAQAFFIVIKEIIEWEIGKFL